MSLLLFIQTQSTVDWSSVMAELPLPQRVGKTAGGGVVFFTGMHVALKEWLERKWSAPVLVELQAPNYKHLAPTSPWCPRAKWGCRHMASVLPWTRGLDPRAWPQTQAREFENPLRMPKPQVLRRDPMMLGHASRPRSPGSYVETQSSWILCPDP